MSLFDTVKDDDVLEEIKTLDVSHLTPIDALNHTVSAAEQIEEQVVI